MFRPLLYLEIGDIDEAFENLLSNLPGVGNENRKIQQFVHYLRSTWIGTGPGKDQIWVRKKLRRTKLELKDAKITILKLKYSSGELEMMDFLKELSGFIKEFDLFDNILF